MVKTIANTDFAVEPLGWVTKGKTNRRRCRLRLPAHMTQPERCSAACYRHIVKLNSTAVHVVTEHFQPVTAGRPGYEPSWEHLAMHHYITKSRWSHGCQCCMHLKLCRDVAMLSFSCAVLSPVRGQQGRC